MGAGTLSLQVVISSFSWCGFRPLRSDVPTRQVFRQRGQKYDFLNLRRLKRNSYDHVKQKQKMYSVPIKSYSDFK